MTTTDEKHVSGNSLAPRTIGAARGAALTVPQARHRETVSNI
jgi:hypothetical protein